MDPRDYEFLFSVHTPDPQNREAEPVFQNQFLEKATETSPLVTFLVAIPVIAFAIIFSVVKGFTVGWAALLIWLAGFVSWSPAEYLIHRFLYHSWSEGEKTRKVQFIFHGFHHKHPRDRKHMFMPFYGLWALAALIWLIFFVIMGTYSFMFFAGFFSGYLYYVFLHYFIHRFAPPFRLLQPLWEHHLKHHYQDTGKAFGLTSTLWDRVFGTMPSR